MRGSVVFAGTPVFAEVILESLIRQGFNIVAVFTQPDRPSGRGLKLVASPVKQLATAHGIPVKQPASLRDPVAQAELAALSPDVMVVAAYGLILPQAVLDIPRWGCLNVHGSLLPRWRGAAPIQRAILAGDSETGVCIMRMEAGLDTGPVLQTVRVPIRPNDTAGALHDRLAIAGAGAMAQVLAAFECDEPPPEVVQPDVGVTYAQKISPADAVIDWMQDANAIDRCIRAFNPVPGAATMVQGERIKIWQAEVSVIPQALRPLDLAPGSIVRDGKKQLWIGCGTSRVDGLAISPTEIQRPGGKRIPAEVWLASEQAPITGEHCKRE